MAERFPASAPELVPSAPQTTIWSELEAWGKSLPDWKRLILALAVRHGQLSEPQVTQVYQLLLSALGLGMPPHPPVEIPASLTGTDLAVSSDRPRVIRIHGLEGVNALTPAAELTFSPELTVVYGGNGAGKSGFARILNKACFSRNQGTILPNIYAEAPPAKLAATITYALGAAPPVDHLFDGLTDHADLKRFAVFDSTVADKHANGTGQLGFSPAGFDVFAEMARVYGLLASRLAAEAEARPLENRFLKSFIGTATPASRAVADLSADTKLDEMRELASYGADEIARIEEIGRRIAELQSTSQDEMLRRLKDDRDAIRALLPKLAGLEALFSQNSRDETKARIARFYEVAREVAASGAASFSTPGLISVGTPEWEAMIKAVHEVVGLEHAGFPEDGDICLVCQQILGSEARDLYARYQAFIGSTAQTELAGIEKVNKQAAETWEKADLGFYREQDRAFLYLSGSKPTAHAAVLAFLDQVKADQAALVKAIRSPESPVPDSKLIVPETLLQDALEGMNSEITLLEELSVADSIKRLEDEKAALRHREVLSKNFSDIGGFVAGLQWRRTAEQKGRTALNPRHLTDKTNELFALVIAESYRNKLAEECQSLGCAMPIRFQTRGDRGTTLRSLRVGDYALGEILSEGEQRAVALADFLTEAAHNPANAGLIFDDPVNSQDHIRKDRIASRLVQESKDRQVIVFTHDLLFFTKICGAAKDVGLEPTTHWIQRGPGDVPGFVSLNDAPISTPQYRNVALAESALATAKDLIGSQQVEVIRKGAAQLRRTIEEIVPFHLFKEVVTRWSDRVIVTALKKIDWDHDLNLRIIRVFEHCSAMMEGHSHTESGEEAPPTPDALSALIEDTREIIRIVKKQKAY